MKISFLLNGETVCADLSTGTETLLDFIREDRGLKGTKEGCNEGDCGACSVIVKGDDGVPHAVNACIMLLPQVQGRAVRTVEGVSAPDGPPHPVQQAMIENHGSQCGFCTPGFITTMAAAHAKGETDFDAVLAGNLCRCTGYAPIVKAAAAAQVVDAPTWMADTSPNKVQSSDAIFCPTTRDELAEWYLANPNATLIAGATDVGLWVTKSLSDLAPLAFLSHVKDLAVIEDHPTHWRFGAGCTIRDVLNTVADVYPSLANMLKRYGSLQVRNSATLGGNIANGSPIGDSPPALIALGATLHLRKGHETRTIRLEDFFVDYGKQDSAAGEFVTSIDVPKDQDALRCYKLSKRFDQDISTVCGSFNVTVQDGTITVARLVFGGMAGTPKRAQLAEDVMIGQPWTQGTIDAAMSALVGDFTPMSDQRASAEYRMHIAQNLMQRYFEDLSGQATDILAVQA